MGLNVSLWGPYGSLWFPMGLNVSLWGSYESIWIPYGSLWVCMVPYGFPMVPYGSLWGSYGSRHLEGLQHLLAERLPAAAGQLWG